MWETIATTIVAREDSGFYQTADFALSGGLVTSKLRLSNMFDMFECDIIGAPVPEPSSILALSTACLGLLGFARRRTRR